MLSSEAKENGRKYRSLLFVWNHANFPFREAKMTPDDYMLLTVSRHSPPTGLQSPVHEVRAQLQRPIKSWAKRYLLDIRFSGSYAKCTRVIGCTDADLLISLGPRTPGTMKQIYKNFFAYLAVKNYGPRQQNISIGITYSGLKIDLIPAKKHWGSTNNLSLFEVERQREIQTNIDTHISLVRQSHRLDEIKATKIWHNLRHLRFPSFYLELTVLNALRSSEENQPAANILTVLEYLRDKFISSRVSDPANSNNIISDDLMLHERMAISRAAADSLKESDWGKIIW